MALKNPGSSGLVVLIDPGNDLLLHILIEKIKVKMRYNIKLIEMTDPRGCLVKQPAQLATPRIGNLLTKCLDQEAITMTEVA